MIIYYLSALFNVHHETTYRNVSIKKLSIPVRFFKYNFNLLGPETCNTCNESFDQRFFLRKPKSATVEPFVESGDVKLTSDYRSLTVFNSFNKVN